MDMIKNVDSKTYLLCCILALLSSLPSDNYAQSIKRQVISSYGSSGMSDHVFIGQTAGQSFNTTMSINGVTVSQGFQQPVTIALEEIEDQVYTDLNVLVYPNPATRSITISSKEEIPSSFIQVKKCRISIVIKLIVPYGPAGCTSSPFLMPIKIIKH